MIVNVLRVIASLVIAALAAAGVYRLGYIPIKVNYYSAILRASGEQTEAVGSDYQRILRIRRDLALARTLMQQAPEHPSPYTIAAGNEWLLGRREEAIALYERALTLDKRAETLLRIGILHCELGRIDTATPYLLRATLFNHFLRFQIPQTCPHDEVDQAAVAHAQSLR